MSTLLLKDLVAIQGSYISAVDIAGTYAKAFENPDSMVEMEEKVKSYLVDDSSIRAILTIAQGLSPGSNERAHLVSGAYGTGKSHVGLVLANYFALSSDHPCFEPLFSQITQQDADKAAEIRSLRTSKWGFLVVIITGVGADTFNQALLQGLRNALRREKLLNLIPTTAFDLARDRMDSWKSSKPDLYRRFVQALDDLGQTPGGVVTSLENYDDETFKAFCQAHQEACDAAFEPFREDVDAKRFYADISEKIAKETDRFQRIVVIWDEYGEYLKSIAQGGGDRQQSQFFAQFCNNRAAYQCHFIVIAHLTLRDYFTSPLEYEEYIKESGRFKESRLTTSNAEELIARAMTQLYADNPVAWEEVKREGNWGELVQVVMDLDLYPMDSAEEKEWLGKTVIEGCFPLYPLTVYCLPRLSEEVAQRNRTTFAFLSQLRSLLDESAYVAPGRMNLYPMDSLFDYFREEIEEHKTHRRVFRAVTGGQQQAQNDQQVRILKAIGIFNILKDKKLTATADTLFAALYLPEVQRSAFDADLNALVSAEVLRKTAYTGEYKFRGGEEYDYAEDFKNMRKRTLDNIVNPVQPLNLEHPADEVPAGGLKADDYNRQYSMDRKLKAQFIGVDALEGISEVQLVKEVEQPPYYDGICLYVIASSQEEIRRAKMAAERIKHSQAVIAIPKSPTSILEKLIDFKTAESLRRGESPYERYSKFGADAYEEAKEQEERRKKAFDAARRDLLMPDSLVWYVGGEVEAVSGRWAAEDLASRMMFDLFPDTPKVTQERVAYKWRRTQRKQIVEVLDDLMDFHTPIKLRARGAGNPSSKELLLSKSLYETGLLEFQRNAGINDDYEVIWPADSKSGYKVWIALDEVIKREIPKEKLTKAITVLQKPPLGMSDNAIAVFLAAYIRHNRRDLTFLSNGAIALRLTGETVYRMVQSPSAYTVVHRELNLQETHYLKTICRLTTHIAQVPDRPTIQETARCLKSWFNQLSSAAKSGQGVSNDSKSVLASLTDRVLPGDEELLFSSIPEAVGLGELEVREWDAATLDSFENALEKVIVELGLYSSRFAERILAELRRVFKAPRETDDDLADAVRDWFNSLSPECQLFPHVGPAHFLMVQARSDATIRQRFLVKLPEGFGLDKWSDWSDPEGTITRYIQKVTDMKRFLQGFRVEKPGPPSPPTDWKEALRDRLEAILHEFSAKLSNAEIIEVLTNKLKELSCD